MQCVSDFTYATSILSLRLGTPTRAGFVLAAAMQMVHERRPTKGIGHFHHSAFGSQHLSLRNTERLAVAGIDSAVRDVG
jgi:hypothetical protein